MHRWTPRTGIPAKTVTICDKIGGISARIGRTFKETVPIAGRTTEICEQTVRRCGRTASNSSRMNILEPARDNSNRTGNRCGTTVTIFRAIVGISEPIARTGEVTGRISEEIDRIGIRIGRTCAPTGSIKEQTGKGSVAGINNGQATVDRARFAIRQGQTMWDVGDCLPHRAVPSTYSTELMCASVPSPSTVPSQSIGLQNPSRPHVIPALLYPCVEKVVWMAAEQTLRHDMLRSYADAPECLESSISADIHGGTACHNPCRGRRRLDDLARDDRLFVIRIDRTEPMIAIGNEDLAMDRVPDEQERGYRLSRCDFFPISFHV